MMDAIFWENMLATTFKALPPLVFAGLGGMITAKVGMLNLGLEGMMLMSAFVAAIVDHFTSMPLVALFAAAAFSTLIGLMFGLFNIRYKVNNIIISVAINTMGYSLTKYLLKTMFDVASAFTSDRIIKQPTISLPFLEEIPVLRVLSGQSILFWLCILTTLILMYVINKTPAGLRLRATGLNDVAVNTTGVSSNRVKYVACALSGLFCGLGGAYLSTSYLSMFTAGMTSGRGYLGNIASILGNRTAGGTFLGALLFSVTDGLTMKIQTFGFPSQLIGIIPYAVAMLCLIIMAVIGIMRSKKADAALKK